MADHPKKEHAEHLRTIQFTMALFSVALVAAVFLNTNTVLSRAHKQAQNISAAMDHSWTRAFVWDHASRHVRDSGLPNDALSSNLEWRFRRHSEWSDWTSEERVRTWVFVASDETSLSPFTTIQDRRERLEAPKTLGDFINLWNLLHESEFRYLTTATGKGVLYSYDDKLRLKHETNDGEGERLTFEFVDVETRESETAAPDGVIRERRQPQYRMRLIYYSPSKNVPEATLGNFKHALAVGVSDNSSLEIPCAYGVFPLHAQRALNRKLGREWPLGRFETSFPELAKVTKEYKGIELPTLERVLFNELNRESRFNILGVNFPAGAAAAWGVPLLMVVQIYFLIHLIRFDLSDPDRPHVPWIGLYPSPLARIVFALSSVFLVPVVTITVFASQLDRFGIRTVGLGACCLATLVIAKLIWSQQSFSCPLATKQPTMCCDDQS